MPFPCSLRELVLDRYGETEGPGVNAHPMQTDELLGYLKSIDNFSLSPWVALVGQTEAIGDPATPSREQIAILRWLGKALELWEKQYPLEGRIAAQVRRLKPLSAALAVTDPLFMQPGAHPMHQLLDTVQARAIGWQARLDRVGAVLEQQVARAVDESRQWFDNQAVDLGAICAEFTAAAGRDQARSERMVQRVVEIEAGKVKTAAARQEAARMINTALARFPAPEAIGDFLKGPWYSSAQLLLLKFGKDSEQWQKMSVATETLLDSLQATDDADEERRQHIFEVVTRLPKEMRRWLLSLHHDTEAVNEAMGQVEYAHLKILRKQALDLKRIEPIADEGEQPGEDAEQHAAAMKPWQQGQWFIIDTGGEGVVRAQLVLKMEQSQQLLFTNLAGIKVLQLGYAKFIALQRQGKVKPLNKGASFSLCLAHAVGIDSVEIMNALASALTAPVQEDEPAAVDETALADAAMGEASPEQPEPGDRLSAEARAETVKPSSGGFLAEQALEIDSRGGLLTDRDREVSAANREASDAGADTAPGDGHLADLALQLGKRTPEDTTDAARDLIEEVHIELPAAFELEEAPPPAPTAGDATAQPADAEAVAGAPQSPDTGEDRRQINLPMGAWLGFHDGETPMMARLAVHDPEEDYFIFVNRQGVKLRQISREDLLRLIDSELVDILEAKSNFRDAVTEVRRNLDQ